ncbi:S-layer homology domain-containing protein [Mitsuokella sp.]|uniref:S-layer homology domain-containing protein n=1 Tax=Mitsuokella sp. TaxID=2049034 RepID=UPI003D7E4A29
MKKFLAAAVVAGMTACLAGSVSAASNPFSDVPADHWAYDALAQLAKDGVIEGYGDTTFQGNKNITRYEMAQMVAKAMAKTNVPQNDKALLDKLSAEFSDELNNLGVRVSNLEKNADKVKWNGEARYTYTDEKHDDKPSQKAYPLLLRMEPKAEINANWFVKARIDASTNLNTDSGDSTAKLQRTWAEGRYAFGTFRAGKLPFESPYDSYMTRNSQMSGAEAEFPLGSGFSVKFTGGRQALKLAQQKGQAATDIATAALQYKQGKLSGTALYLYAKNDAFKGLKYKGVRYSNNANENKAGVYEIAGTYRFDKNAALTGAYGENTKADNFEKLGLAQFNYKGVQRENQGTWGAYVAYKHNGGFIGFDPNSDALAYNQKGWEVGAQYMVFKNTMASVKYFDGKDLDNDKDASKFFGRVQFFF